jgi:hypothetical protein
MSTPRKKRPATAEPPAAEPSTTTQATDATKARFAEALSLKGIGCLVHGLESQTITPQEYQTLRACLAVLRGDETLVKDILDVLRLYHLGEHEMETKHIVHSLIDWLDQHYHDDFVKAILTDGSEIITLNREELFTSLADYSKAIQSDSWLGEFLALNAHSLADGEEITPRQVMQGLTTYLAEFEGKLTAATETAARYPKTFKTATMEQPETVSSACA